MNERLYYYQKNNMGNIVLENFERYTYDPKYYGVWITANRDAFGIPHDMPFTNFPGNSVMGTAFYSDFGVSFAGDIDYLLTQTKVLIFNGQLDIIVNTPGVQAYMNQLSWQEIWNWKQTPKQLFKMGPTKVAGSYKHHNNLTFVLLYGSGHYVTTSSAIPPVEQLPSTGGLPLFRLGGAVLLCSALLCCAVRQPLDPRHILLRERIRSLTMCRRRALKWCSGFSRITKTRTETGSLGAGGRNLSSLLTNDCCTVKLRVDISCPRKPKDAHR